MRNFGDNRRNKIYQEPKHTVLWGSTEGVPYSQYWSNFQLIIVVTAHTIMLKISFKTIFRRKGNTFCFFYFVIILSYKNHKIENEKNNALNFYLFTYFCINCMRKMDKK